MGTLPGQETGSKPGKTVVWGEDPGTPGTTVRLGPSNPSLGRPGTLARAEPAPRQEQDRLALGEKTPARHPGRHWPRPRPWGCETSSRLAVLRHFLPLREAPVLEARWGSNEALPLPAREPEAPPTLPAKTGVSTSLPAPVRLHGKPAGSKPHRTCPRMHLGATYGLADTQRGRGSGRSLLLQVPWKRPQRPSGLCVALVPPSGKRRQGAGGKGPPLSLGRGSWRRWLGRK